MISVPNPCLLSLPWLLVPIYAGDIQVEDDMLKHLVKLSGGSVRRVCVNLELIQDTALTAGWSVVDRTTWGKNELYTGEAPKRRI